MRSRSRYWRDSPIRLGSSRFKLSKRSAGRDAALKLRKMLTWGSAETSKTKKYASTAQEPNTVRTVHIAFVNRCNWITNPHMIMVEWAEQSLSLIIPLIRKKECQVHSFSVTTGERRSHINIGTNTFWKQPSSHLQILQCCALFYICSIVQCKCPHSAFNAADSTHLKSHFGDCITVHWNNIILKTNKLTFRNEKFRLQVRLQPKRAPCKHGLKDQSSLPLQT